ncbi:hypothetical protein [Brevibacillus brevis]|uniref:hypothetical protein n=1 Tax=Brevibacillus brevis TaxID=1393 RepID=UPI001C8D5530|nr:hypothetical protein [Brevibacillus brevis]MBY0088435.1 hypothetical protein [Brevibacillus brevis]
MRKFHEFDCKCCGEQGREVRRVDLKRKCPWSIIAHMECDCGSKWTTYIRDESRITPYDVFNEEDAEYEAV